MTIMKIWWWWSSQYTIKRCKYALQTQCASIMFLALFLVFCANWWLFSETYEVTKTNKASMLYRSVPHNSVCPVSITLLTLSTWPKVVWGKLLDKYNWRNFEMNTTHNFWWLYCSHYQYAPGAFTLNFVNFTVNTISSSPFKNLEALNYCLVE